MAPATLGLPDAIDAILFDLDGVLTRTASVHAAAWKATFDAFLEGRDEPRAPFDIDSDYLEYVDGRPRADGVRSFLRSRDITLPEGEPGDPVTAATVHGLGNRKNELLLEVMDREGVEVFPGSRRYLDAVRAAGLPVAVVSASANAAAVLESAGLSPFVDTRVDGVVAAERGLPGKPAPDTFLAAADELGVAASSAAVFEDAIAGVAAARAGGFGHVVGVDRAGQSDALRTAGADVVVDDLADLLDP